MTADKVDLAKDADIQNPLVEANPVSYNDGPNKTNRAKLLFIVVIALAVLLLCSLVAIAFLCIELNDTKKSSHNKGTDEFDDKGAVVSDHDVCSQIGRKILASSGTAVDAAIATLVCNGVMTPHSMGIGGGSFMVIYDKSTGKSIYIDGREIGPQAMNADQFYAYKTKENMYRYNGRRVGIPGELKLYKQAHTTYGRLPWKSLFQPTLDLMASGMVLRDATHAALVTMDGKLKPYGLSFVNFTELCDVFCSNTKTGEYKTAGDKYFWPKLRATLQKVADQGPDYLYNGPITSTIVQELRDRGSLFTVSDFQTGYKLQSGASLKVDYRDFSIYTMGGATGGPVVAEILNILEGYNFTKNSLFSLKNKTDTYHKMIESMKFAYADRELLEDPDFGQNVDTLINKMVSKDYAAKIRERITDVAHDDLSYYTSLRGPEKEVDMGTSHVSVLSPNGDAVSVTTTINWYFGSLEMSPSTGILWNNEMDDFSKKESPHNEYKSGKRPRSSMAPVIVVDKHGKVRFVVGASGGSRITTSVAQVIAKMMWMEDSLQRVMEDMRFHQALLSSNGVAKLEIEKKFNETLECLTKELENRNHHIKKNTGDYMSVVESIYVHDDGRIEGVPDSRKLHRARY